MMSKLSTKATGILGVGLLLVTPMAFPSHDAQAVDQPKQCFDNDGTLIECVTKYGIALVNSPGDGPGGGCR